MESRFPQDLDAWLAYIEAQHPKSIAMGLERTHILIQRLNLYPNVPIVMVGGTNGKGSTTTLIEHIYHEAGYRVGCYTSPHLIRYNERVRLNGRDVTDTQLCQAFAAIERVRDGIALTYFEYGTLSAVWLFMQQNVDVMILEVGLGGRLDAVNAFTPTCSIVTSIDLDHTEYLGDTREAIAFEKAGIFRHHVAAICGEPDPPDTLLQQAEKVGAYLLMIGKDFGFVRQESGFIYQEHQQAIYTLPQLTLKGEFQFFNASCAICAVRVLQAQLPVNPEAIHRAIATTTLMGRFQKVRRCPDVIFDVAHNPHAAISLAKNLQASQSSGRTRAVFAMLADKDVKGVIHAVMHEIDNWYIADIDHVRGAKADFLRDLLILEVKNEKIKLYADAWLAFESAYKDATENDRIIVFGSFFTVALVMERINQSTIFLLEK